MTPAYSVHACILSVKHSYFTVSLQLYDKIVKHKWTSPAGRSPCQKVTGMPEGWEADSHIPTTVGCVGGFQLQEPLQGIAVRVDVKATNETYKGSTKIGQARHRL